jgi:hypothetical protein
VVAEAQTSEALCVMQPRGVQKHPTASGISH